MRKGLKKLVTVRWLSGHVLALTLVVLFINFGFWQLDRHEQRRDYNALLSGRLADAPEPYGEITARYDLRAEPGAEDAAVYRRALVEGSFDREHEVLLRSQSHREQPGYHVLTPLLLEDGRALLVNRGWVPYAMDDPPIEEAPATREPDARVWVSGILYPRQQQPQGGLTARDPAEGALSAVFWIDTERLAQQMPYMLEPVYLRLEQQSPAAPEALPITPPAPELTQGSHLSYAVQWFSFAAIGIIGYAILLRSVVSEEQDPRPKRLQKASPSA